LGGGGAEPPPPAARLWQEEPMSGTWDATILSAHADGTGEPIAVDPLGNA
jgi:hypothetical protein